MVVKTAQKWKINVEIPFGPFRSPEEAALIKNKVKAKASRVAFTQVVKSRSGYSFKGRLSYSKSIAASKEQIVSILKARTPRAKISVVKA